MPRRMAGLVTWRRGTGMSPSLRRGAVANVVVAASLLMLLHRWDSPHGGEGAGVAAFVFVSLRHTAQMAQTDFGTSSDRSTRGVDATPPTALAAASKGGGGAISRGRKSSGSSKSGGGFGKVATRPVPEDQGGLGRQRSAAAVSPPNEHGEGLVDSTVVLDKWGLPPPTIDDIFPPLPEGTELVHVGSSANHTLEQIQDALRHVVPLTLDRHFDEFGVERDSAAGRSGRSEPDHDSGRQRRAMKLRLLHQSPPVLAIENFFTPAECEATRRVVEAPSKPSAAAGGGPSPPVQVGSRTFVGAISRRTSTSWFCCYEQHPVLLAKAVHVLGLELPNMEEPQVVRYQPGQEFSFHYDQVPAHQTDNGGQRLATLLYVFVCALLP
jgi:hypothetical protein